MARILIWHGWLLSGSGSNVATARLAEAWRRAGHDVVVLCQESHPEVLGFVDASGRVDSGGVRDLKRNPATEPAGGTVTVLRPDIGDLLPVFVLDEYEGFMVKRFTELTDDELNTYLSRNVEALRAAAAWRRPEVVFAGHAVPGPVVAGRALGAGAYVAEIRGSDLEYAIRLDPRYAHLAAEGLAGAKLIVGGSEDVLRRTRELVPSTPNRLRVIPPGVDTSRFRPGRRAESLRRAADLLEADRPLGGRPGTIDEAVTAALRSRDATRLDRLAATYDQDAPDPDAAARLRALADRGRPVVGYIGKFIPQKGAHLLLAALSLTRSRPDALLVGFGSQREWLTALSAALPAGPRDDLEWLRGRPELPGLDEVGPPPAGGGPTVSFTGRLDHRYAPEAIAAMDVLVVPSILAESFGMVTVEGAAAGALPLAARHSGLAEVTAELERVADRPGLFSFEPGPGTVRRIADGIDRLLAIPRSERRETGAELSRFSAATWSWDGVAERLLTAAGTAAYPSN